MRTSNPNYLKLSPALVFHPYMARFELDEMNGWGNE